MNNNFYRALMAIDETRAAVAGCRFDKAYDVLEGFNLEDGVLFDYELELEGGISLIGTMYNTNGAATMDADKTYYECWRGCEMLWCMTENEIREQVDRTCDEMPRRMEPTGKHYTKGDCYCLCELLDELRVSHRDTVAKMAEDLGYEPTVLFAIIKRLAHDIDDIIGEEQKDSDYTEQMAEIMELKHIKGGGNEYED